MYSDIKKVKSFLESGIGGAWNQGSEIHFFLNDISDNNSNLFQEIENLLLIEQIDFLIFYYSGHGSVNKDDYSDECLKVYIDEKNEKNQILWVDEILNLIKNNVKRAIIIFNSCRTGEGFIGNEIPFFNSNIDFKKIHYGNLGIYLNSILEYDNEYVIVRSTQQGKNAFYTYENGTLFTESLLKGDT